LLILADDGHLGGRVGCFKPQCPVWTVLVVVLDIDPQDVLEVASADDQEPVQALAADGADPALRVRVRPRRPQRCSGYLGASELNTSSKLRENFASRSRSRKCGRPPRSPSINSTLRVCWVAQWPSGWAVTPARWTRRVRSSMKNSTYSRRSQMVSTVKKSQATIPAAC
jgi:hypothetical protein